jgi:cytochrome c oxidase cbb3-type subunit 3
MSDFTSEFWNWWVIVLTAGGIAYCAYLLLATGRMKAAKASKAELTGHTWDGDLAEYNNPLPRWWMWMFWITIAFSAVYLVLYPGLGRVPGMLGWTSTQQHAKETADFDAKTKPLYDKYLAMDLTHVAADPAGRAMGERIFLNNCAQCHGSDAAGSRGFPNLRDGDWLYGGAPEAIETSIAGGRNGVMPPQVATLGGEDNVKNVVAYVRSLSGLSHDSLKAQLGKPKFAQICAACHGADGKGNQVIGAPNLTDGTWLYGSSEAAIAETVTRGRGTNTLSPGQSVMPAWKDTLGAARVHLVAAYVWSLSNGAAK